MDAVWEKSLGSTTVDWRPLRANSLIMSVHWVKMNSWLASAADTPELLMTASDSEMPSAMALRWAAMPRPACSMASARARASVTTLMRSASASDWAASFSRWAELMRFMDCSTSAGRSMAVISVLTTS